MKYLTASLLILAIIPAVLIAGTNPSTVNLDDPELYAQGYITVRFADGVDLDGIQSALAVTGAVEVHRIEQLNAIQLTIPDEADIRDALGYYESRPDVLYAQPVAIRRVFWTPNDPLFPRQWHFDTSHINMPAAWNKEKGSSTVIVAIVDTGIAYEEYPIPEYEADEVISDDDYYHMAPDFTASQFVAGYDIVHEDEHPNDQYGHGTHVAGTVAQATNNGIGTAGMAPDCKLMPVQVMNYTGSGYDFWIADGITWAADHGADVVNLSLGSLSSSEIEHDAIIYAHNKGVVIVASAGNSFIGILSYPARFEECIAVAATNYNDTRAVYSQYGTGLDISAPGGATYEDKNNDGYPDGVLQCTYKRIYNTQTGVVAKVNEFAYHFLQGTSMAAPHVSGLAALLISHGITGVDNVKNAIYTTARDLGTYGYDKVYGWGMIDPAAALDYVAVQEESAPAITVSSPGLFSHSTFINYTLPVAGQVTITVWDAGGRRVRTLVDSHQASGEHSIQWDGTDDNGRPLSSGAYFYRIKTPQSTLTQKAVLVR